MWRARVHGHLGEQGQVPGVNALPSLLSPPLPPQFPSSSSILIPSLRSLRCTVFRAKSAFAGSRSVCTKQCVRACVPARVSVWASVSARSCVRERTSVMGCGLTAVRAEQADGSRIGLARYLRDRIPHTGRACCCQGGKCAIEKRPPRFTGGLPCGSAGLVPFVSYAPCRRATPHDSQGADVRAGAQGA